MGSTVRTLQTRVMEHAGISVRTGRPLTSPLQSAVRTHNERCSGGQVLPRDFSVLGAANSVTHLRILESIYIYKEKPNLNETDSAFPLKILK